MLELTVTTYYSLECYLSRDLTAAETIGGGDSPPPRAETTLGPAL